MMIKFSRHAKRRAKLYDICESDIEEVLRKTNLNDGKNEVVAIIAGNSYPIKIIFSVESDVVTVISNYPVKKGLSQ